MSERRDVVVIGAGFAGLSAAVDLAKQGARVLVLEARPRLGGRATAFTDGATGELVDNGQHVLFGCYGETFRFLREIGAEDHVQLQPTLDVDFALPDGRRTKLGFPALPPPLHLVAGILDWDAIPFVDRVSVLKLVKPLRIALDRKYGRTAAMPASPGETIASWLVMNGQSQTLRELFWEPLALAALNQSPREAAALPFTRVLAEMFGTDRRAASVGLPTVPLDRMYAEPARAYLERHGGEVRTGSPARVLVQDGRVTGVQVAGETVPTASVVTAVPWFAFAQAFAEAPEPQSDLGRIVAAASAMVSSPIVTINLWLDRAVLDVPFIGLPGRDVQWVFDKRFVFGETASHLSLVSSGATDLVALGNDDLIARATAELVDALPAVRRASILRATVVREPHATFSLSPHQPARPGTRTPIPNLVLAGDWIETGLPGTIESAVVSGHRAAAVLAERA